MPKQNTINGKYAQQLKNIRRYVDFDFDLRRKLSPAQKRKITIYHKEVKALTARPFQAYRPRTAARLNKAQQFAQHEKKLSGLKVAFIPSDGKHKARISFNDAGEISAATEHVITRAIDLDKFELMEDPENYIKEKIKEQPRAKQFTVQAGRYEIPLAQSRRTIPEFVGRLAAKYADEEANNFFGNWLHGINAHTFKKQSDFSNYNNTKSKAKRTLQMKRKAAKKKAQRK